MSTNSDSSAESPLLKATQTAARAQVVCAIASVIMILYAGDTLRHAIEQSASASMRDEKYFEILERPQVRFERSRILIPLAFDSSGPAFVTLVHKPDGTLSDVERLPKVCNFGVGAALDIKATFTVYAINDKAVNPANSRALMSASNLLGGASAYVYELPECISFDRNRSIRSAVGEVYFECSYGSGRKGFASQPFNAQTLYDSRPPQLLLTIGSD